MFEAGLSILHKRCRLLCQFSTNVLGWFVDSSTSALEWFVGSTRAFRSCLFILHKRSKLVCRFYISILGFFCWLCTSALALIIFRIALWERKNWRQWPFQFDRAPSRTSVIRGQNLECQSESAIIQGLTNVVVARYDSDAFDLTAGAPLPEFHVLGQAKLRIRISLGRNLMSDSDIGAPGWRQQSHTFKF